jgi:DNA-binding transcriptional LysR family regulator
MTTGSVHVTSYRTDRLVVIMPTGHPLAGAETVRFAEMAEYDIVGPQQGSCLHHLMIRAALGRSLQVRIRVNGFEPSSSMVEAGLGIALVSEHHALRRVAYGQLVIAALDEPWAVRQWKICSRDPKALPVSVRLLLDYLSARSQQREHVRVMPPPGMSPLPGYAPIRSPALDALVPAR